MNTQLYVILTLLVIIAVGGHIAVAVWLWRLSKRGAAEDAATDDEHINVHPDSTDRAPPRGE